MINDFKLAHGMFPFTTDEDGLAEEAPLAIYMAPTKVRGIFSGLTPGFVQ
jgi:hypothetical protein